ncbi:uncharacterized protein LOC135371694 [Ornithodoros turicata]|uniref:uncharacterized protein LOC135371694 n=1 Tax=Ornithodoros turicata TaxID=34597 RepID=UPI0031392070
MGQIITEISNNQRLQFRGIRTEDEIALKLNLIIVTLVVLLTSGPAQAGCSTDPTDGCIDQGTEFWDLFFKTFVLKQSGGRSVRITIYVETEPGTAAEVVCAVSSFAGVVRKAIAKKATTAERWSVEEYVALPSTPRK